MLVVTFFFGMQFLLLGIVGEYLYRIYAEVVRRPEQEAYEAGVDTIIAKAKSSTVTMTFISR